jgi:hypothetical protein
MTRGWIFTAHPGLPVTILRKRETGHSSCRLVGDGAARVKQKQLHMHEPV